MTATATFDLKDLGAAAPKATFDLADLEPTKPPAADAPVKPLGEFAVVGHTDLRTTAPGTRPIASKTPVFPTPKAEPDYAASPWTAPHGLEPRYRAGTTDYMPAQELQAQSDAMASARGKKYAAEGRDLPGWHEVWGQIKGNDLRQYEHADKVYKAALEHYPAYQQLDDAGKANVAAYIDETVADHKAHIAHIANAGQIGPGSAGESLTVPPERPPWIARAAAKAIEGLATGPAVGIAKLSKRVTSAIGIPDNEKSAANAIIEGGEYVAQSNAQNLGSDSATAVGGNVGMVASWAMPVGVSVNLTAMAGEGFDMGYQAAKSNQMSEGQANALGAAAAAVHVAAGYLPMSKTMKFAKGAQGEIATLATKSLLEKFGASAGKISKDAVEDAMAFAIMAALQNGSIQLPDVLAGKPFDAKGMAKSAMDSAEMGLLIGGATSGMGKVGDVIRGPAQRRQLVAQAVREYFEPRIWAMERPGESPLLPPERLAPEPYQPQPARDVTQGSEAKAPPMPVEPPAPQPAPTPAPEPIIAPTPTAQAAEAPKTPGRMTPEPESKELPYYIQKDLNGNTAYVPLDGGPTRPATEAEISAYRDWAVKNRSAGESPPAMAGALAKAQETTAANRGTIEPVKPNEGAGRTNPPEEKPPEAGGKVAAFDSSARPQSPGAPPIESPKIEPAPEPSPQAKAKEPWEHSSADIEAKYPKATGKVDGRTVGNTTPNEASIDSSIDNPTILSGIREVPVSAFDDSGAPKFYSASEEQRTRALAEEIRASGRIDPLIVVDDGKNSPYILEGGHRFDALKLLGAKSFPAKIVVDKGAYARSVDLALRSGKPVPRAVLEEYRGQKWADSALAKMEGAKAEESVAGPAAPEEPQPPQSNREPGAPKDKQYDPNATGSLEGIEAPKAERTPEKEGDQTLDQPDAQAQETLKRLASDESGNIDIPKLARACRKVLSNVSKLFLRFVEPAKTVEQKFEGGKDVATEIYRGAVGKKERAALEFDQTKLADETYRILLDHVQERFSPEQWDDIAALRGTPTSEEGKSVQAAAEKRATPEMRAIAQQLQEIADGNYQFLREAILEPAKVKKMQADLDKLQAEYDQAESQLRTAHDKGLSKSLSNAAKKYGEVAPEKRAEIEAKHAGALEAKLEEARVKRDAAMAKLEAKANEIEQYVEDYFYGNYKNPEMVGRFLDVKYRRTTDRFLNEKTIPTAADAQAFGLELRDRNPVANLRSEYVAIAQKAAMRNLREWLLEHGRGQYVVDMSVPGEATPEQMRAWKTIGDPAKPEAEFKGILVDPDMARLINNLIATNGIMRSKPLRTVRALYVAERWAKMSFSMFHQMGMGILRIADSGPGSWLNPANWKGIGKDVFTKGFEKYDKTFQTPEYKEYTELGGGHGYSVENQAQEMIRRLLTGKDANVWWKVARLPARIAFGLPRAYTDWLFERYIPHMKYSRYLSELQRIEAKTGEPLSPADKQAIIKEGQNFYGEMNERLFGRSSTMTSALRLFAMAPGFREGKFRTMGKAMLQWTTGGPDGAPWRSKQVIPAALLFTAVAAALGTRIGSGQWPTPPSDWESFRDLFKIKTGRKDDMGREVYIDAVTHDKDYLLPFEFAIKSVQYGPKRAAADTLEELGKIGMGMQSPAYKLLADVAGISAGNVPTDYRGQPIYSKKADAGEKALAMGNRWLEGATPISGNTYMKMREGGQDYMTSILGSLIGVRATISEHEKKRSEAEELAQTLMSRKMSGEMTPEELDRWKGRQSLIRALRSADQPDDIRKAIQDAADSGRYTPAELREAFHESRQTRLEHRVGGALSVEDAFQVWQKAQPAEQESLRPIILKKIRALHDRKEEARTRAALDEAIRLGILVKP